jgi:hypothetical protein
VQDHRDVHVLEYRRGRTLAWHDWKLKAVCVRVEAMYTLPYMLCPLSKKELVRCFGPPVSMVQVEEFVLKSY